MTDMRATERLLEVIEENAHARSDDAYAAVLIAVQELRRRGDTLVRADDLRLVVEGESADEDAWDAARDRLENALGGKMR